MTGDHHDSRDGVKEVAICTLDMPCLAAVKIQSAEFAAVSKLSRSKFSAL